MEQTFREMLEVIEKKGFVVDVRSRHEALLIKGVRTRAFSSLFDAVFEALCSDIDPLEPPDPREELTEKRKDIYRRMIDVYGDLLVYWLQRRSIMLWQTQEFIDHQIEICNTRIKTYGEVLGLA